MASTVRKTSQAAVVQCSGSARSGRTTLELSIVARIVRWAIRSGHWTPLSIIKESSDRAACSLLLVRDRPSTSRRRSAAPDPLPLQLEAPSGGNAQSADARARPSRGRWRAAAGHLHDARGDSRDDRCWSGHDIACRRQPLEPISLIAETGGFDVAGTIRSAIDRSPQRRIGETDPLRSDESV